MEVASKCDVVYQTRIQKERFGERTDLYDAARGKYIVDQDVLNVMQKHAVVMHPLPRLDEVWLQTNYFLLLSWMKYLINFNITFFVNADNGGCRW